jgi:hypothetical protein
MEELPTNAIFSGSIRALRRAPKSTKYPNYSHIRADIGMRFVRRTGFAQGQRGYLEWRHEYVVLRS